MSKFRRRLMGLSTLRPHIKDEFVRVEYIENVSNAYIDTKLFTVYNDGRTYKHIVNLSYTVTNERQLNGANGTGYFGINKNGYFECAYVQDLKIAAGYSWHNINFSYYNPTNTSLNIKYEIDNQLLEKNISKTILYNYPYAIYIFAIGGRNDAEPSFFCKERIKSYQIYIDDVLVRNFIPVLNKTTNEYGLYDLVEQKFYVSPNGAKFVGGREIIYDAEIEYLESNGTQLIDTLYVPKGYDNTIETKITHLGYSNTNSWLNWFTTYVNEETNTYRIIRNENLDTQVLVYNGNKASGGGLKINVTVGTDYDLKLYPSYLLVNGTRYNFTTLRGNANTNTLRLFGAKGTKIRMWGFKLTKGSTVVLDMIPVRVGNVGYMYDKVSGELFGNDGSGEFILGKDVELYDEFKTDVCEVHPKLIANTYINENSGAQQNYDGWSSSDYIDVEGFKYIQVPYPFSKMNYKYGAYYDKDKNRISNTASLLTIPSNAKYVRLSTTTGGFTNVWLFKRQLTTTDKYRANSYIETDGSIRAYNGWNIFNTESVYNYFYCLIYEQSYRYQASYNTDGSVYQSGKGFLEKPKYGKVLLSDNHTSITYYAGYNYEYKNMNE